MTIAAILFAIVGLLFNVAAIVNNRQPKSTENKGGKSTANKSAIFVSIGMANIAIGMMFVALHFVA